MMSIKRKHLALSLFTLVALPLSKLQASTTSSYQEREKEKSNQNKRPSKALIIAGITTVVIAGGAGVYWWSTQSTTQDNTNNNDSTKGSSQKKIKKTKKTNNIPLITDPQTSDGDPITSPSPSPTIPVTRQKPYTKIKNNNFTQQSRPLFDNQEKKEENPFNVNTNNNFKPFTPKPTSQPRPFVPNPNPQPKPKKKLDINEIITKGAKPLTEQEKKNDNLEQLKALSGNALPKGLLEFIKRSNNTGDVAKNYLWEMMGLFLTKHILQHFQKDDNAKAIDKTVLYKDEVLYGDDKQDEEPIDNGAEIERKERICERFKNFLNKHKKEKVKAIKYFENIHLKDTLKDKNRKKEDVLVATPFSEFKESSMETTLASMYNQNTSLDDVRLERYTNNYTSIQYYPLSERNSYSYNQVIKWRHEAALIPCWERLKKLEYDEKGKAIQELLPDYLQVLLQAHNCSELWHWITPLEQHNPQEKDPLYSCIIKLLYSTAQYPNLYELIYKTRNKNVGMFPKYENRLKKLYERLES